MCDQEQLMIVSVLQIVEIEYSWAHLGIKTEVVGKESSKLYRTARNKACQVIVIH